MTNEYGMHHEPTELEKEYPRRHLGSGLENDRQFITTCVVCLSDEDVDRLVKSRRLMVQSFNEAKIRVEQHGAKVIVDSVDTPETAISVLPPEHDEGNKVCDCGHTEQEHGEGDDAPCSKCSCINPVYQ